MADSLTDRRRQLMYLSTRRGMRESDLLLGAFARRHLQELDEAQLDRYAALLDESDDQLLGWITGRQTVPPQFDHDVMEILKNFKLEF